jgi:hypothetical protein
MDFIIRRITARILIYGHVIKVSRVIINKAILIK